MAIDILTQSLITALLVSITYANGVHIKVEPEFVRPGDQNVTFTCAGNNDTSTTFEKVIRIRLMKLDYDEQWKQQAVLRFDGSIDMNGVNAVAVGRLGDEHDSFLKVTWLVAPDDVNGRYHCDVIALTSPGDVITEQSIDLDVKSLSSDVSFLLERLRKTENRLVGNVKETMFSAMKTSRINLFSLIDSNFDDLKEYLDNKTDASVRRREKEIENVKWPGGQFTLLMPSSGCPLHPPSWLKGFKRMKVEKDDDKYYPINAPLHLARPHKKDGFVYRQFCTLRESPERTKNWPAGSYCLMSMKTNYCPTGFKYLEAKVKIPSDKKNFFLYYYPNHSPKKGTFQISASRFCCRNDGEASNPIDLPVSHPFYFFSIGGRCQEVNGMDVTQDVFMMETVDDDDYDKWTDGTSDFHPDVSFQPYKEELCYYSRS